MKIISLADIHGDFETFDKALQIIKLSDSEILSITGDLAGGVFNEEERAYFNKTLQLFYNIYQQIYEGTEGQVRTIHDAAQLIVEGYIEAPSKLRGVATDYLDFERKAEERMARQYQEFRQRFDDLGRKVLLVPGNWDGKCLDDFLAYENLHLKSPQQIKGIEFIGYGGSKSHPIELPLDLTIGFNEDEAFFHLSKYENAEVVLMHECPKGFSDNISTGEYCMLAYLYRNAPSLILTGHSHLPYIAREEKTGTIIANPGNLGRYENQSFGTFLEIEIDENTFVNPRRLYKIKGDSCKVCELEKQEVAS